MVFLSHIWPLTYEAQQRKSRAKDQMNFQREMSNTAYQRAMHDMKKAGLNPILAGKLGGASTPPGAMAGTPEFGKAFSKMDPFQMKMQQAQTRSAFASARRVDQEARLTSAKAFAQEQDNKLKGYQFRVDKTKKEIEKIVADIGVSAEQARKLSSEANLNVQRLNQIKQDISINKWRYHWEKVVYGAPMATMKASWLNYITSMGIAGMTKEQQAKFRENFNKGFAFLNKNFERVLADPSILEDVVGVGFAGWILKQVIASLKSDKPKKDKRKNKNKTGKKSPWDKVKGLMSW